MKAGQLRQLFERRRRRKIRDFQLAAEAHPARQLGAVGLFGNGRPYSTFGALR